MTEKRYRVTRYYSMYIRRYVWNVVDMQDKYISEVSGEEQYRRVYKGTSAECNREAKRLNAIERNRVIAP